MGGRVFKSKLGEVPENFKGGCCGQRGTGRGGVWDGAIFKIIFFFLGDGKFSGKDTKRQVIR